MPNYPRISGASATVTAGTTTVTFAGAGIDFRTRPLNNATLRIGAVTATLTGDAPAADQVTLTQGWAGADVAAQPWEIIPFSSQSELLATLIVLTDMMASKVPALCGTVPPTADIGIDGEVYLEASAGVAKLHLKAAGAWSQIIDLTSGAIADARLPARLGTYALLIDDWDDAVTDGWYRTAPSAAHNPGADYWLGRVDSFDGNLVIQTAYGAATDPANTSARQRVSKGGVFGAWYPLQISQAEQDARYPRMPNSSGGGVVGSVFSGFSASTGAGVTLPAGGTWLHIGAYVVASLGQFNSMNMSVVAGGTTVGATSGFDYSALAWRIA